MRGKPRHTQTWLETIECSIANGATNSDIMATFNIEYSELQKIKARMAEDSNNEQDTGKQIHARG